MKKLLIAAGFILSIGLVQAQQKEGTVLYERVSQVRARFNMNGQENEVNQTRKENFELTFGNNQSLWKAGEKEPEPESDGGGMRVMMIGNSDNVLYNNFETGAKVEKREMFDKTFIIDDSISKTNKWKMTGETKVILGFPCMKATATTISKQTRMMMNDGKMERKEVEDTANIVAWFTTSIPVSAGPAEFQGQLPGLILELNVNNGRQTYTATAVSAKADIAKIKAPTGKKHYTRDEYKIESDKMMKQMQENMQNGGGGFQIRRN